MIIQFLVQNLHHIIVIWRHNLPGSLNNRYLFSSFTQILSCLNADKTAANYRNLFHFSSVQIGLQSADIRHVSDGKHIASVDAFDALRHDRLCPWRKNQLVITFLKRVSRVQVFHRYSLSVAIDRCHLMSRIYIYIMIVLEIFRKHHNQVFIRANNASEIVRERAIGKGNMCPSLKNDNLCFCIQSARPCSRRRTAGYTAYNNQFHKNSPFKVHKYSIIIILSLQNQHFNLLIC